MVKVKIYLLLFLFFALSGLIVWKLCVLQIKNGEYYKVLALGQQVSFAQGAGGRGDIICSDGATVLAKTRQKNLAYIFPDKAAGQEIAQAVQSLAAILGEKEDALFAAFKSGDVFKREISGKQAEQIQAQKIPGVQTDAATVRFYPQNDMAANVLGFVNESGEGQYGIEAYYDKVLRGKGPLLNKNRGAFSYLSFFLGGDSNLQKQENGATIFLTIDKNIQYFAEKLLKKAKESWDVESAQIVVVEPSTGRILALADWPSFNPNNYGQTKELSNFLNPVAQTIFEPGSVFKPITMAAGLAEKLVTPETKYVDEGFVSLGGPVISNFNQRVWGEQTMADVLEESINTGMVFVEQKLGPALFMKYAERFGLFKKTGIDLAGEVSSGNNALKHGYPRDFAAASFGQGIEITPIQLAMAFSAIANQGKMMKPFIVEKIIKDDNQTTITKPQMVQVALDPETAYTLTYMLTRVVKSGSGRLAQIPGYAIAGKTGTAQVAFEGAYHQDKTIQSFAGFFPAENPRAVVLVKLDNPRGVSQASQCAVPLAGELIKYILDLWQIPPSGQEILPWP